MFPSSGNILAHEKHLKGSFSSGAGLGELFFPLNLTIALKGLQRKSYFPALMSEKKVLSYIVRTGRNTLYFFNILGQRVGVCTVVPVHQTGD